MKPITLDKVGLRLAAVELASRDRLLADLMDRVGPPSLWKRPLNLGSLIRIILEQQVSLASAKGTFDRLVEACDGRISAERVRAIGTDGLRSLGFSRQKARYAASLAGDVLEGRIKIPTLRRQSDQSVRATIVERLGMGPWSADMVLLLVLCRSDVFPAGDLAIVRGLELLDQRSYRGPEEMIRRAESWRPYRSVATRLIWKLYLDNQNRTFD